MPNFARGWRVCISNHNDHWFQLMMRYVLERQRLRSDLEDVGELLNEKVIVDVEVLLSLVEQNCKINNNANKPSQKGKME